MSKRTSIFKTIKILKEYYGVIIIKAEFEDEGSRKDELIMLKEYIDVVGFRIHQ